MDKIFSMWYKSFLNLKIFRGSLADVEERHESLQRVKVSERVEFAILLYDFCWMECQFLLHQACISVKILIIDWLQEAEDKGMPPIVVVGNKCDLENERNVSYEEGQELTKRLGDTAVFFEASAKTNINVDEVWSLKSKN